MQKLTILFFALFYKFDTVWILYKALFLLTDFWPMIYFFENIRRMSHHQKCRYSLNTNTFR